MPKAEEKRQFVRRVVAAALRKEGATITQRKATILANQLWSFGLPSQQLAEAACNRELTPREESYDNRLDKRVEEIGKELGLTAYRQGDPRGWTIRVKVPKDLADCWDGETTGCG